MTPFLAVLLMFSGALIAGLLAGFLQLAAYRLLGRRPTPPFVILFARGLLGFFVLAAVLALVTRIYA